MLKNMKFFFVKDVQNFARQLMSFAIWLITDFSLSSFNIFIQLVIKPFDYNRMKINLCHIALLFMNREKLFVSSFATHLLNTGVNREVRKRISCEMSCSFVNSKKIVSGCR